jgi:hypothetical protein
MSPSLAEELRMLVHKWERGNLHSAGAYDEHCETCQILSDLRVLLLLHAHEAKPEPAAPPAAAAKVAGRGPFGRR